MIVDDYSTARSIKQQILIQIFSSLPDDKSLLSYPTTYLHPLYFYSGYVIIIFMVPNLICEYYEINQITSLD